MVSGLFPARSALLDQAVSGMRFKLIGGYGWFPSPLGRFGTTSPAVLEPRSVQALFDVAFTGGNAESSAQLLATRSVPTDIRRFLRKYDVTTVIVDPLGNWKMVVGQVSPQPSVLRLTSVESFCGLTFKSGSAVVPPAAVLRQIADTALVLDLRQGCGTRTSAMSGGASSSPPGVANGVGCLALMTTRCTGSIRARGVGRAPSKKIESIVGTGSTGQRVVCCSAEASHICTSALMTAMNMRSV